MRNTILAIVPRGILRSMEITEESVTAPGLQVCSADQAETIEPRLERILK